MKQRLEDLAVFGGPPRFATPLVVGRPNIGDRAQLFGRLNDILDRRWLSNGGRYVQEFEERIARLTGAGHCIALSNGTVALELAARAYGLTGEVIVPSFTFVATAHAIQWQGLTPVFCDIDEHTHNIDPLQIESLITPRTSAILAVHLWGRPAPVDLLTIIAARHGLRLLFDASHALACSWQGKMVGGFGDAEILSFHATKFLNTFEGGAVVTNDAAVAAKLRSLRNFGFAGYDKVEGLGTNAKMSEPAAAMGLTGLDSLDEFIAVNRSHYRSLRAAMHGIDVVRVVAFDERESCNYQYLVLELGDMAGISRDQLVRLLVAEGIIARRYFYPGCHRSAPYSANTADAGRLMMTERVSGRVITLPTGSGIDRDAIDTIAAILRFALLNGPEIARRMGFVSPDDAYRDP